MAAGLIALGAISPATGAQEGPPVGPSATIGALGAMREAARAAPAATPSAAVDPGDEVVTLTPAPAPTSAAPPAASAAPATPPWAPAAPTSGAAPASGAAALPATAVSTGSPPVVDAAAGPSSPPQASAATPTPAGPVEMSPSAGGPKTFLINDGAPGIPPSGWFAASSSSPAAEATGAVRAAAEATATPSASPNSAPTEVDLDPDETALGTTVIPPVSLQQRLQPTPNAAPDGSQIVNYQANQQMPLNEPQLHSLQEFMNEGVNSSPLGVELQEGARRMKDGREVDGLLVVALQPGSPAERAGVQAGHRQAHDVLEGAAVAASLVFPPAVLAVPVIETMQIGENYDLIIGIDGNRVTNFMDFQDQLRDAQPGETVYFNILRSGKRLQVPVEMPAPNAAKLEP